MNRGVSFLPEAEGKRRLVTMARSGELEWEPGGGKPYAQKRNTPTWLLFHGYR